MLRAIDFSVSEGIVPPFDESEFERIVEYVLAEEEIDRPCLVSVSLVMDDEIRELNAEWRGIDAVTDVISLECERPDDPDLAEDEPCELGDIVLAPAYIADQAQRLGTGFETEFTLLLVHGMLHLLGYDHLDDDEARAMEAREDALVSALVGGSLHAGLTRHAEGD